MNKSICMPTYGYQKFIQDFADWGRGPGNNEEGGGGVLFDIGESKNLQFFQTRKFSKMLINQ